MDRERFRKLIHYLKKRGWIEVKKLNNKEAISITRKGQTKLSLIVKKISSGRLYKRSDKKYQMIMYDIPQEKNKKRASFRRKLKELGYTMIQKSIWVSPYDVLEQTKNLVLRYDFDEYVRLLLVEEIEIE